MHLYRAGLPLLGFLSLSAQAAPHPEDLTAKRPGLIQLLLKAPETGTPELSAKIGRRDQMNLTYTSAYKFEVEFSLGTPGQKIVGIFDTGSACLWVREKAEASVDTNVTGGRFYFDKNSSSTLTHTGESVTYGYGVANSSFRADLYRDSMSLAGFEIKNASFGIIDNGPRSLDSFNSIFGFGMVDEHASGMKEPYVPTMTLLADQGLIGRRVFSLEIGNDGVLLGGVNRKKFWGRLGRQRMTEHPVHGTSYVISFNEVYSTAEDGSKSRLSRSDKGIPVLLDTGTSLNIFPPSVFQKILSKFPQARSTEVPSIYRIDCSLRDVDASIDLAFGKTLIRMPYSNFIIPAMGEDDFYLGMRESQTSTVLGYPFLRSAYIVMDQDNSEVYLANAADCGSNPIAIDEDDFDISSLSGQCQPPVVDGAGLPPIVDETGFPPIADEKLLPWKEPGENFEACANEGSEDVCGTAEYCRIFPGAFGTSFATEFECLAAHRLPPDNDTTDAGNMKK